MRILAVTPGAELYGSDRMFLEAVRGFLQAGHEVTVLAGAPGPLLSAAAEAGAQVDVAAMPVLRRSYASAAGLVRFAGEVARALPALTGIARRSGADVSYVNTATLPVWSAIARAVGLPLVVHVHEAESCDRRIVRRALSAPLLGARRVVFNSRTSSRLARGDLWGGLDGSTVVPNAVEFRGVPTAAREHLTGPVRLVYVGRLSARKGADLALEAVALLAARGVQAHLDVVGEVFAGNEDFGAGLRARAARADLAGRVTFHGFQADPSRIVAAGDIVLVPSRGPESFGNVLVEAAGAARPAVVAAQAGLLEASHGLGSVEAVAPDDAVALAEGIARLVERWDDARLDALADAAQVRERHDCASYRGQVTRAVTSAVAADPSPAELAGSPASAAVPVGSTSSSSSVVAASPAVSAPISSSAMSASAAVSVPADELDSARELVGDAPVLVVSPHLDDAVLSAYALLDLGRPVDVLTVLDGAPTPVRRTSWDRLSGFADSGEAVATRVAENAAAFAGTAHVEHGLGLLDAQYLDGVRPPADTDLLTEAIQAWAASHDGPVVIAAPAGAGRTVARTATAQPAAADPTRSSAGAAPTSPPAGTEPTSSPAGAQPAPSRRARRDAIRRAVGPLGRALLDVRATLIARHSRPMCHDDHVWVRDTVLRAAPASATVLLYEDLPYLWGRPADDAVAALDVPGRTLADPAGVPVDRVAKARRVGAYASQLRYMHAPLGPLDSPWGLPPVERYWALTCALTGRSAHSLRHGAEPLQPATTPAEHLRSA